VLVFVSADRALEVAVAIGAEFMRQMAAAGTDITLSAGVLIMPEHTPVRFARDLVEQLLKHAKERSKSGDGAPTIDFMALKATTMIAETIADYRRDAFQRTHDGMRLTLTERPYTLDRLAGLIAASRALRRAHFPRSQLYQLRELVQEGQQLRSMVDYRYYVERGKQRRGAQAAYAAFDAQMAALCEAADWLPWRRAATDYDTPILDLIEIAPFVAAEEEL
jgi:CRISPR RNA silencing complex Cmr2 subunit-like protein